MSSQETTSSGIPGRRMHAWNFTRARGCLRRSSGRPVAWGAAEGAGVADLAADSGGDWCAGGAKAVGANCGGGGATTGSASGESYCTAGSGTTSGGAASANDWPTIGAFAGTAAGDAAGSPVACFQTVEDPQRLQ